MVATQHLIHSDRFALEPAEAQEAPQGAQSAPTIDKLVLEATHGQPRRLQEVYRIVMALRPGTAPETIRARIYEACDQGRIFRVARGVYIAIDGPARMVLVEGDAWETLRQLPDDIIDCFFSDIPFDCGTAKNARIGTTRPHKDQGRTYEQRDLDRAFLVELFRVMRKAHQWSSIAPRKCAQCGSKVNKKTLDPPRLNDAERAYCPRCQRVVELAPQKLREGGGAVFILTPPRKKETRPHIDALLKLAEKVGFQFQCEIPVRYRQKGMGYWLPEQHWLLQFLTAGPRDGVPHDLSVTSCWEVDRVLNRPSRKGAADAQREHEAEKPVEVYLQAARLATRPGDIILDAFAGRCRANRDLLRMGRHLVLVEKDATWPTRIAHEDWGMADAGDATLLEREEGSHLPA